MKAINAIRDLIEGLNLTIKVQSIEAIDGLYRVYTCNPLYTNQCTNIAIDGVDYKVIDVADSYIDIQGDVEPSTDEITLPPLVFKHGMPIDVNGELISMERACIKTMPLAYLVDSPLTERWRSGIDDCYNDVEVRLFLLNSVGITFDPNTGLNKVWNVDDHYKWVLCPMLNVAKLIETTIKKHKHLRDVEDITIRHRKSFGTYENDKGNTSHILNKHLSGIEMVFTLGVKHSHDCCIFAS